MSRSNHPIEQEELMAYLDGELATDRAVAAAAHLEHCAECQELAADLRKLSQELMTWEVEQPESSAEISDEIAEALEKRKKEPRKKSILARRSWNVLLTPQKLVFAGGSAVCVLLVIMFALHNSPSFDRLEHFNGPKMKSKVAPPAPQNTPGDDNYGPNSGAVNGSADAFE